MNDDLFQKQRKDTNRVFYDDYNKKTIDDRNMPTNHLNEKINFQTEFINK